MNCWPRPGGRLAGSLLVLVAAVLLPTVIVSYRVSAADDHNSYVERSPAEWQEFIETNCVACHSERKHEGGLVLAGKTLTSIGENAAIWEKVAYKVSEGEMPPLNARTRPDPHESAAFASWLTASLDREAAAHPDAGRPVIRRLTRSEYNNAVRDLLNIEMNTIDDLPADAVVDGFDNIGDALTVSPLMLERYIRAARLVTRAAIGDTALPRTILTADGPDRQTIWREGVPLGAHRGPVLRGYFPNAGEYVIRVIVGVEDSAPVEGRRNFTTGTTLTAGAHRIAAMVPEEDMLGEGPIADIEGPAGRIAGPLNQMATTGTLPKLDVRVDGKLVQRFDILRPTADDLQAPNATVIGAPLILRVEVDGPVSRVPSTVTAARAQIGRASCRERVS
jgi:mono/diheme cytochrome c family protein